MFGIAPSELMIVALVAIVFIGPKDLPRVMRVVGLWVGRGRGILRNVHGAVDDIIREAELQDTRAKWKLENDRILLERAEPAAPVAETSAIDVAALAPTRV